jgi:hypothetical protein
MTVMERYLQLAGTARELLVSQVPNEILNGFDLQNFKRVVGVTRDEFKLMVVALRATSPGASISSAQAIIFRNALAEVMKELGTEFQTRTGYELTEASVVLGQIDAFLGASQGGR